MASCRSCRGSATTARHERLLDAPRRAGVAVAGTLGVLVAARAGGLRGSGALVAQRAQRALGRRSLPSWGRHSCGCRRSFRSRQVARSLPAESHVPRRRRGGRAPGADGDRALRADGRGDVRAALRVVRASQSSAAAEGPQGLRVPGASPIVGQTHVYNAVPLDASTRCRSCLQAGVAAVRARCRDRQRRAMRSSSPGERDEALKSRGARAETSATVAAATTSGHFFRGVS